MLPAARGGAMRLLLPRGSAAPALARQHAPHAALVHSGLFMRRYIFDALPQRRLHQPTSASISDVCVNSASTAGGQREAPWAASSVGEGGCPNGGRAPSYVTSAPGPGGQTRNSDARGTRHLRVQPQCRTVASSKRTLRRGLARFPGWRRRRYSHAWNARNGGARGAGAVVGLAVAQVRPRRWQRRRRRRS